MSPLSWVTLFLEFCLIFLLVNSINYFSFNYNSKTTLTSSLFSQINWKW